MPPPSQPFSKRHGYIGQTKEITIRDDAPKDLRFVFLGITRALARECCGQYPEIEIRDVVAKTLGKWFDPGVWHYQEVWEQIEPVVYDCEWFRVYDLMEAVNAYFRKTAPKAAQEFTEQLNDSFVEQDIGWQLLDGRVVRRGDEMFEGTLKTGITVLEEDKKPTAAGHLRFAISALSSRPKANTSGAVAHATSAVECVLGEITGQAMTLGKYLDKNPSLFHPALKKGLDGIYGYASDEGARHGKEGTEPTGEEAEFAVAVCAAACTLLTRKRPNDGSNHHQKDGDLSFLRSVPDAVRDGKVKLCAGYATSSRLSLLVSVRTCAKSYCACCTSQLWALPPNTLDSLTAISGETPRFPFTSSESVVRVTPSASAARVMVKPRGSMHSRSTKPPGCGGFFIGMRWFLSQW